MGQRVFAEADRGLEIGGIAIETVAGQERSRQAGHPSWPVDVVIRSGGHRLLAEADRVVQVGPDRLLFEAAPVGGRECRLAPGAREAALSRAVQ
jgi:hypothetical protein